MTPLEVAAALTRAGVSVDDQVALLDAAESDGRLSLVVIPVAGASPRGVVRVLPGRPRVGDVLRIRGERARVEMIAPGTGRFAALCSPMDPGYADAEFGA